MSSKYILFDESDDETVEQLKINKSYAANYNKWRRGEEIQKLKDKYGESDETSSSSEDEFVEPDNPEFDTEFIKTLGAIYSKDEKHLQKKYFVNGNNGKMKIKNEKLEKPFTLNDYQRHVLTEKKGVFEDDEEDDCEKKDIDCKIPKDIMISSKDFKDCVSDSDEVDNDLLVSGLFNKSKITKNEDEIKQESEVIEYIKGNVRELKHKEDLELIENVKNKWTNPNMSESDKWLADFFLNRRYLDNDDDKNIARAENHFAFDPETLSEDEETCNALDAFESSNRFRFEEPDSSQIKQYPRTIKSSVRQISSEKANKKRSRQEAKLRKCKNKEQKKQEILRLRALKKKEIQDKINLIKATCGEIDFPLDIEDLYEDFDPSKHDKSMNNIFNSEYYEKDVDINKPEFCDDDYYDYGEGYLPDCDDPQFNKIQSSKSRKKNKADIESHVDELKHNVEEFNKLSYEDIVGDTLCRFKYRQVEPNSFGLTTEEILVAKDSELNAWYSLQKLLRNDRSNFLEEKERNKYSYKSSLLSLKKKILPSLYKDSVEEPSSNEELINCQWEKKLWDRQSNINNMEVCNAEDAAECTPNISATCAAESNNITNKKHSLLNSSKGIAKKKKPKRKKMIKTTYNLFNVSEDRLSAYGVNAKKLKNKIIYGKK